MFKYLNKKTDRPNQKRYEEHPLITPNQSSCTSITSQMSLHVKREVVGPGEGTITQVALEGPVTGVFAEMPCQFVGASEFPAATVPTAMVWLFTCRDKEERNVSISFRWDNVNSQATICIHQEYGCVIAYMPNVRRNVA